MMTIFFGHISFFMVEMWMMVSRLEDDKGKNNWRGTMVVAWGKDEESDGYERKTMTVERT